MKLFQRRLGTRAIAALAVLMGGLGASSASALSLPSGRAVPGRVVAGVMGTKVMPAVEDCGLGKPEVRPSYLTLACADANTLGSHLKWSKWGPTEAYATGIYTWNTCVPYCAASKVWDSTAANFTLSKAVKTKSSGWLFETLLVHITGKLPRHIAATETISEAPFPKTKA
jgi:hypothetical protein